MANDPAYLTVKSCFEYIRQRTPHVDFWGISDHNHAQAGMSRPDFHLGRQEADSMQEDHVFCSFYGMEWGVISTGGHVILHGIDSLIGWEAGNYDIFNAQTDYNGLFQKVTQRIPQAMAYLAHMEETDFGNLLNQAYNPAWDSAIVGVAVRNGPAFSRDTTYSDPPSWNYLDRYFDLLSKGYHVAPGIDHDSHYIVFGRAHPGRTVIIADSLTRESLMEALRARRFYASDDWNTKVKFSIGGYGMGSRCSGPGNANIFVSALDDDAEAFTSVKIYRGTPGSGIMATLDNSANGMGSDTLSYTSLLSPGATAYFFAEFTQADGEKIWTAPIWYTRNPNPLAFELIDFSATVVNKAVELKWTTLNETDILRFDVERSADGLLFATFDTAQPQGTTGQFAYYALNDSLLLNGSRWYRLSAYDATGLNTLSPIRRVDPVAPAAIVNAYPNPSNGEELLIDVFHTREEPMRMTIHNSIGQLMNTFVFSSIRGTLPVRLSADELASGMYIVEVHNSDYSYRASLRIIRK